MKDKLIYEFQALEHEIYFLNQLIKILNDSIQYKMSGVGTTEDFDCMAEVILSKADLVYCNYTKLYEQYIKKHII